MAVKSVRLNAVIYEHGAPSYCEVAGQYTQITFPLIYESMLMTGSISPAVFNEPSLYKPCVYRLPDPINCLIPAFDLGRTKPHTYLSEWHATPPELWYEVPPVSAVDAQVLMVGAIMPDQEWQLVSKFALAPNQPFAFALVLFPAVRDDLTFPYVRVIWGNGEWEVYFRPDVEPMLLFRGHPVLSIGRVYGEIWHSSPLFKVEGAIGAILALPVRGHMVLANARDWHPLQPTIAAFNPYLFGKPPTEPIHVGGPVVVQGRGAAAMFSFPSVDFSVRGELLLPTIVGLQLGDKPMLRQLLKFPREIYLSNAEPVTDEVISRHNPKVMLRLFGLARPAARFYPQVRDAVNGDALTIQYLLRYELPSPQAFFELVALGFYVEPKIVKSFKQLVNLPEVYRVTEAKITVDERDAEALLTVEPRSPTQTFPILSGDHYVELTAEWVNLKGIQQTLRFKGFVGGVEQTAREGSWGNTQYQIRVTSIKKRLEQLIGDNTFPPFDGFTVSEVFAYCLAKAGLDPEEFLHFYGNDFVLSPQLLWAQPTPEELPPELLPQPPVAGFPYWWRIEEPRFTVKIGQSVWEFLRDVARMSGNEIIVDGLGVWVIPSAYEQPTPIITIVDASRYGTTTPLTSLLEEPNIYLARQLRVQAEPTWMPTTYAAFGKDPFGFPIYLYVENSELINNPKSPAFRGYRASNVVADDKLASPFLLWRAAFTEYLTTFRQIPLQINVTLTDIPAPGLGVRDRVTVHAQAVAEQLLSQISLKPFPASPNEFIVRRSTWVFSANPAECSQELVLTPPANIPYGFILPKK